VPSLAVSFSYTGRMFVTGRGPQFATAREIALKLLETCRIAAEPLTATDLAHGPVAALDPLFPVWAIASPDETLPAVLEAAERIHRTGATIVASGPAAESVTQAAYRLPTPVVEPLLLAPLLSVVPGQLFAWALALAKGLDPDAPRGLTKVTLAR
jgi:glucosamine--fructose-6-phosphate aminotransferase (isomerizing)